MNVSSTSSASLANISHPAQPAPIKRDKDGDYDNNARETKQTAAPPLPEMPGRLNVTA